MRDDAGATTPEPGSARPTDAISPDELEVHELPDRTALSAVTAGLAPGVGHLDLAHPLPISGQPPDTASDADAEP